MRTKNGQITSEHLINDFPSQTDQRVDETRDFTYDALGRLTQAAFIDNAAGTASSQIKTYTYDAVGNRIGETENGESVSSAFNEFNQLTSKRTTSGGILASYAYDANGNMITETEGGKLTTCEYDALNRLAKATVKENGAVQSVTQNLYNGDGKRIRKSVQTGAGSGASTKTANYFYQDDAVGYTTDLTGARSSLNILSPVGSVISSKRYDAAHSDKFYLYTKDQQNSTMNLLDDTGSFAKGYTYGDFGQTSSFGDDTLSNEICYTGGIYDESTGEYYLNARYYNPENGRFLTMDTYRGEQNEPQSLHLYAYCANNPVNFTDPSGHKFYSLYSQITSKQKSKLTKKEREAIKSVPNKYTHFHRNDNNKEIPECYEAMESQGGWHRNLLDACHQHNRKTKPGHYEGKVWVPAYKAPNIKYNKGKKEVIFYWDGSLNDTPEDRGTYNYEKGSHVLSDVVPWIAWGNSSEYYGNIGKDTTTCARRKKEYFLPLIGKAKKAMKAIKKLGMYGTVA